MARQTSETSAYVSNNASLDALIGSSLDDEKREFVARLRRLYKADHQAEYLYIQAEIDSLCIQLEHAKRMLQHSV